MLEEAAPTGLPVLALALLHRFVACQSGCLASGSLLPVLRAPTSVCAVMIVDGKMQYLFDETGRRYLDVSAPHAHCCPRCRWCCCRWCRCRCRRCLPSVGPLTRSVAMSMGAAACCSAALPQRHHPTCCTPHPHPPPPLLLPQAFAGIVTVSVGHCHPEVNRAVIEQTQRLQVRALRLHCVRSRTQLHVLRPCGTCALQQSSVHLPSQPSLHLAFTAIAPPPIRAHLPRYAAHHHHLPERPDCRVRKGAD